MQASIAYLLQRGSNLTKLENQAVRVASEDADRNEGIDGFLLETITDPNSRALSCRIINARTNEEERSLPSAFSLNHVLR